MWLLLKGGYYLIHSSKRSSDAVTIRGAVINRDFTVFVLKSMLNFTAVCTNLA